MKRSAILLAVIVVNFLVAPVLLAQPQQKKGHEVDLTFSANAKNPALRFDSFMLHNVVIDPVEKSLRLANSVLLTDELGATDFHQGEGLSKQVHAKKIFVLDAVDAHAAELFFFGAVKEIVLNGKELPPAQKLVSTGWSRAKLPTGYLKAGKNEIIFKGGGSLLVEPGKQPGHSFKSNDGGKTWSKEGLTGKGNQEGEYVVRLRLGKYASSGWAKSQIIDLWKTEDGGIATPSKVVVAGATGSKQQPVGTQIAVYWRTGATAMPDGKSWTEWTPLKIDVENYKKLAQHRWAQLKFELSSTNGLLSPRVKSLRLICATDNESVKDKIVYKALFKPDMHHLLSSTPFVYQAPSPRLKLLREKYKLDDVIAPGKTELEQLMLLRYWVRNQWHTAWGSHPAQWMPAWDALMILANKDQPDCLTMCTHYAAVYTQCCQALGWNARHCILDHHCVAEVYVNDFGKWVMMDAGNSAQRADVGLHFERGGVPMSARELLLAEKAGKTADIQVIFTPAKLAAQIAPLCRPAPAGKKKYPPRPDVIPAKDLPDYPVCGLANYRRYAFPPRNNYLDTLLPGELYQGWSEYFFDGYCWVGDSPDQPTVSPEYSIHLDPTRPHEADWQLNWTQVYLSRTDKPGQVRVDLATVTPNFLHFERTATAFGGKLVSAKAADSSFLWELHSGTNTLTVRSVNQWQKKGPPVTVTIEVGDKGA